MDKARLDFSHGISFAKKVQSLLRSPVTSPSAPASSFWLFASFSQAKFRLDETTVELLLESVLGGSPTLFFVAEIDQWVFKFCVASYKVGFMISALKSFACADFKIHFHLYNETGFSHAKATVRVDHTKDFQWVELFLAFPPRAFLLPHTRQCQTLRWHHIRCLSQYCLCRFWPDEDMAYHFVDPTLFMPRGCNRVVVPGRKAMSHAVIGGLRGRNSNVAIATIEPLPAEQVSFGSIRALLDDFLRNHRHIGIRTIQPCPYGQAFVKFELFHERDFLIHNSPHNYGSYNITFRPHNKGWNNRTTSMNYEVWLMLLGFNLDFWEQQDIEKAIAEFGKLIAWQEDPNHLARIIIKERVVELAEIPWFIVCSGVEGFVGESWTCQCEILQANHLGGGPPDESPPLGGPDDIQPNFFEFFGFGQPIGHNDGPANNGQDQDNQAQTQENPQVKADNWDHWPNQIDQEQAVAAGNNNANLVDVPVVVALPAQGNNLGLDLNQALEEDLGGIEQLVEGEVNMEADPLPANGDEDNNPINVIDEGPFMEEVHIDQNPAFVQEVNVEVFIPEVQAMPDEIHEEKLMDDHDMEDVQMENAPPVVDENIQLGSSKNNAEAVRLWAQFLAPGHSNSVVEVPKAWSDFFTALLMHPASFPWAKKMLSSSAWNIIAEHGVDPIPFALPEKCPNAPLPCLQDLPDPHNLIQVDDTDDFKAESPQVSDKKGKGLAIAENSSPGTPLEQLHNKVFSTSGPWSKTLIDKAQQNRLDDLHEDPAVRRSKRMEIQKNGFKDSSCNRKNCLGCTVKPPSLSPSVIQNLGATFCNMDEETVTEAALLKKKLVDTPGGKRQTKKKTSNMVDAVNKDAVGDKQKRSKK
ncbi:hypothetical protein PVAP13_5KG278800 [Panicum virgatum]|uniref:DUF7597 domain-containing protein n=1 Tax=Panicum virgatum TaxID=38727 RepID=A0A8T0SLF7_PANVG|nr:hypothetical protein PVAP13_5KG278800 [Panicum virgatum]